MTARLGAVSSKCRGIDLGIQNLLHRAPLDRGLVPCGIQPLLLVRLYHDGAFLIGNVQNSRMELVFVIQRDFHGRVLSALNAGGRNTKRPMHAMYTGLFRLKWA